MGRPKGRGPHRETKDPNRAQTEQQQRFVSYYISQPVGEKNAEAAAVAAGYSPRTAKVQASRLMSDPRVQKQVLAARELSIEVAGIDAAWTLTQLADLWETPLTELFDTETGSLRPIHELPLRAQKLIQSFEVQEIETEQGMRLRVGKIKIVDRLKVLTTIGKHTDVNAFGTREAADASRSFSELMRAAAMTLQRGATNHHTREERDITPRIPGHGGTDE